MADSVLARIGQHPATKVAKTVGKGALWGLLPGMLGVEAVSGFRQGRESRRQFERHVRGSYVPTADDHLDELRKRNEALARLQRLDPTTLDNLKWMLSKESQPDVTDDEIIVGNVPTNQDVTQEDLVAAMIAMMEGA